MKLRLSLSLAAAAVAASLPAAPAAAAAAEWAPGKPVRYIVGFPPGGATDLVARAMSPSFSKALGHNVVIDNRPGANGVISLEILSRADPDGLTVGIGHIGALIISPPIQKVPYDPFKDFATIGLMVSLQNIIIAHPTLPVKNTKELIALVKANPGKFNYASSGIGSPGHLAAALFESMTGAKMEHVPYKGGGPAITDLIAGHVPIFFAVISTAVPHVQSGRVKGIAVTGEKRAEAIPNVPTIGETVKGYLATNWYGLMAPGKTPPHIIERLNRDMTTALKSPEVIANLKQSGIDSTPTSPAEFAKFIEAEHKKWVPIIKKANITTQ
jgi:tripartite-type tricarboxylate transporter receptor subunit TctC